MTKNLLFLEIHALCTHIDLMIILLFSFYTIHNIHDITKFNIDWCRFQIHHRIKFFTAKYCEM